MIQKALLKACYLSKNLKKVKSRRKIFWGIENSHYKALRWEYLEHLKTDHKPVGLRDSEKKGEQTEMKAKRSQNKINKSYW